MAKPGLDHLFEIPLRIEASIPGPRLRVAELLALSVGSFVGTLRTAGETVDVFAGAALIGAGELARANGRRAVRMVSFKSET